MPDINAGEIIRFLQKFGITANYKGFAQTACAILLCTQEPNRLLYITKDLLPTVAYKTNSTVYSVERNIRTTINIAWMTNPNLFSRMAGFRVKEKPNTANFLAMATVYFLKYDLEKLIRKAE